MKKVNLVAILILLALSQLASAEEKWVHFFDDVGDAFYYDPHTVEKLGHDHWKVWRHRTGTVNIITQAIVDGEKGTYQLVYVKIDGSDDARTTPGGVITILDGSSEQALLKILQRDFPQSQK